MTTSSDQPWSGQSSASQLLGRYHDELDKMAACAMEIERELASPNPRIEDNGKLVAEGDDARKILEMLLAAFTTANELGGMLRKQMGN
jgi:hypothetical protein